MQGGEPEGGGLPFGRQGGGVVGCGFVEDVVVVVHGRKGISGVPGNLGPHGNGDGGVIGGFGVVLVIGGYGLHGPGLVVG